MALNMATNNNFPQTYQSVPYLVSPSNCEAQQQGALPMNHNNLFCLTRSSRFPYSLVLVAIS